MGLKFTWENETKTILRFDADGDWTWIEYDNFVDEVIKEVEAQDHVVHIILVAAPNLPPGSPIPHLRRVSRLLPQNTGKVIVAGGNLFLRSINTAVSKVFPLMSNRLMFAANLQEAHALLSKITLADS